MTLLRVRRTAFRIAPSLALMIAVGATGCGPVSRPQNIERGIIYHTHSYDMPGTSTLRTVDPNGTFDVQLVSPSGRDYSRSCDGRYLVKVQSPGSDGVEIYDITSGRVTGRWSDRSLSGYISSPRFSPDRSAIAFVLTPEHRDAKRIYSVNSDGSGPRELSKAPFESPFVFDEMVVWSPDGMWVAWAERLGDSSSQVRMVAADGHGEERVIAGASWLDFSPDGKSIVYRIDRHTGYDPVTKAPPSRSTEIVVAGAAGEAATVIARQEDNDVEDRFGPDRQESFPTVDWAPAGNLVAFNFQRSLFVVDSAGNPIRKFDEAGILSTIYVADDRATWSPDGRSIAFIGGKDYDETLFVGSVTNTVEMPQRLAVNSRPIDAPSWSC